ncbi:hypothetical protein GQ42DRAFT_76764 [Ramicandelaber brevisporus]|nr:hypothetical protein GQ42DRAFT_76764 [Ramicandelaber brevisporus]
MDFARSQLEKYGWKQGVGLGKEESGITRSIAVKQKQDQKGVGAQNGNWGFEWWQHVYNKSAVNIVIDDSSDDDDSNDDNDNNDKEDSSSNNDNGGSPSKTTTPSPAPVSASTSSSSSSSTGMTYGMFVKPSASGDSAPSSSASSKKEKPKVSAASTFSLVGQILDTTDTRDYTMHITDEELFAACEGRTARKGARAEQPGKLKRVFGDLINDAAAADDTKVDASVDNDDGTNSALKPSKKRKRSDKDDDKKKKKKSREEKKEKKEKKKRKSDSKEKKSKKKDKESN